MNTLDTLRQAMLEGNPKVINDHGDWSTDLPTFGGAMPENTEEVWSWDEDHLLVGTHPDNLRIVKRSEWRAPRTD